MSLYDTVAQGSANHAVTVTGKDIESRPVTLSVSQPVQLSLFQSFLPESGKYSNTIELYDAIPKCFASPKAVDKMRINDRFLETVERSFIHKPNQEKQYREYKLELRPARVKQKNGEEKEFFLTKREELVEAALRKMAADQRSGLYLDNFAGVQFTLYQLRKELKEQGHSIHYDSLIEALQVSHRIGMTLKTQDGHAVMEAPAFPVLVISNRENWLKNPKGTKCFVQFNPLVTQSINTISYRQFDYIKYMSCNYLLSRWIYSRLAHNYTQAEITKPYSILASTIIRDSHLVNDGRLRQRIAAIDKSLKELKILEILESHKKETRFDGRKISDVLYTLTPTRTFVREIIYANTRQRDSQTKKGKPL